MKRPLVLAAVLAGVVVLSACTAGQPSSTGGVGAGIPAKNEAQWVLPLDQFADQSSALRDYVDQLMVGNCLGKEGVDWPVPWQPLNRPAVSASFTAGGSRLFTEKIAAQYSYHTIPVTYRGKAAWAAAFMTTSAMVNRDPSIGVKFDACLTQVRKKVPVPPTDDLNYATISGSAIYEAGLQEAKVRAATAKWRSCIDAAGFGGLAQTPAQMPGPARAEQWKLGEPSTTASLVSEAERRTASADATCRASSGWSRALYDAEYARQVTFVKKNADRLDRVRRELAKDRARLLAAATQYAPK